MNSNYNDVVDDSLVASLQDNPGSTNVLREGMNLYGDSFLIRLKQWHLRNQDDPYRNWIFPIYQDGWLWFIYKDVLHRDIHKLYLFMQD